MSHISDDRKNTLRDFGIELLPGEEVLFFSPFKDRWGTYRFDLMSYITIGMSFVPYTALLIAILDLLGITSFFRRDSVLLALFTFLFVSIIFIMFTIQSINTLMATKHNYPLILTTKRIITEADFLKKKKPIGTFIEDADKVVYIETTKRDSIIYFKRDGKIHKVPLWYLYGHKEQFKAALRNLLGDKFQELILWKLKIPLTKDLIDGIFRDEEQEKK